MAQLWSLARIKRMPPWLTMWIARWIGGERFRKTTPDDYRRGFAYTFFAGLMFIIGGIFGQSFLDHARPVSIWIASTITGCVVIFGATAWARKVPAAVSLLLTFITWALFLLLALHRTHIL